MDDRDHGVSVAPLPLLSCRSGSRLDEQGGSAFGVCVR
jgi:hypothetical protein